MPQPETIAALRERYPRTAISHEWLTIPGGSEQVVRAILQLLPQSELYTLVYDSAPWTADITSRPVHPTLLDRIPGARRHYPNLLPLMDAAVRRHDLRGYDLVVSSNHACAKNVRVPAGVPHVCYCHTPMRYVWDRDFLAGEHLGRFASLVFQLTLGHLRRTDVRGAGGVTRFVANSTVVAQRIARFYGRDSVVVHPPVDVRRFLERPRTAGPDAPYLFFGRIVPYKHADLAIAACAQLGRPLIVAGDGRDRARMEALAGPETTFVGHVDEQQLAQLLATSRALLFPGLEDFGIVPVEAQAAGLPVIGYGAGGVRDSVIDGQTGVLYDDGSLEGLVAAIERFERLTLDDAPLRANALRFAPEVFAERFAQVLLEAGNP